MKLPHVSTLLVLLNLAAGAPSYSRVTFDSDVLPIPQKRCQECHHSGEIGRMSLISYRDTWGIGTLKNDNSLTQSEKIECGVESAVMNKFVEEAK